MSTGTDFKYIVGTGCSFTWKTFESENPKRPYYDPNREDFHGGWVRLLAEYYRIPYRSYARPGTGTLYSANRLMNFANENAELSKDILFVWGLSLLSRFDLTKEYETVDGLLGNTPYKDFKFIKKKEGFFTTPYDNEDFAKLYLKYYHNEKDVINTSKNTIQATKAWFDSKGYRLILVSMMDDYMIPNSFVFPNNEPSFSQHLRTIDTTYVGEHITYMDSIYLRDLLIRYIDKNFTKKITRLL